MAEAHERIERLESFLRHLNKYASDLKQLWRAPEGLVEVVREELAERPPSDQLLREALTVPSWQSWPHPWWRGRRENPTSRGRGLKRELRRSLRFFPLESPFLSPGVSAAHVLFPGSSVEAQARGRGKPRN
jgi:hypothetical protein